MTPQEGLSLVVPPTVPMYSLNSVAHLSAFQGPWGWGTGGDGAESLESRSLCPPFSCDLSSEIQPSHHTPPDQAKPSELCPLCFYLPLPCSAA